MGPLVATSGVWDVSLALDADDVPWLATNELVSCWLPALILMVP